MENKPTSRVTDSIKKLAAVRKKTSSESCVLKRASLLKLDHSSYLIRAIKKSKAVRKKTSLETHVLKRVSLLKAPKLFIN
jgi:hypothetical protein